MLMRGLRSRTKNCHQYEEGGRAMLPQGTDRASKDADKPQLGSFSPLAEHFAAYLVDAAQRGVLFWDVMRQRSNQYREHMAEAAPHVLHYKAELVMDGRTLERPVNYALARILSPEGIEVDAMRRPFVVVDPRAGHGPGIGGFKADS